jgi:hypothetical protein
LLQNKISQKPTIKFLDNSEGVSRKSLLEVDFHLNILEQRAGVAQTKDF